MADDDFVPNDAQLRDAAQSLTYRYTQLGEVVGLLEAWPPDLPEPLRSAAVDSALAVYARPLTTFLRNPTVDEFRRGRTPKSKPDYLPEVFACDFLEGYRVHDELDAVARTAHKVISHHGPHTLLKRDEAPQPPGGWRLNALAAVLLGGFDAFHDELTERRPALVEWFTIADPPVRQHDDVANLHSELLAYLERHA